MKKPILPMHPVALTEPEKTIHVKGGSIYLDDYFSKYDLYGDLHVPVEELVKLIEENKDKKNLEFNIIRSNHLAESDEICFSYDKEIPNPKYISEYKKWEKDRKNYWEVRMTKYEKLKAKYDEDFKKWDRRQKDQEFKKLEEEYKKALKERQSKTLP